MVSRQDAVLNLSHLLTRAPGASFEAHGEGLLVPSEEEQRHDGVRLDGPLAWRVTVRGTGGDDDLIADGEVSGTAVQECRRCLTDVRAFVRADFLYPMTYAPAGGKALTLIEAPLAAEGGDVDPSEGGEDRLAFGAPEVDFATLLRQLFAIEMPLTSLCAPDCRGLATDGTNLNDHPDHVPEGATERTERSPFAALEDLDLDPRS